MKNVMSFNCLLNIQFSKFIDCCLFVFMCLQFACSDHLQAQTEANFTEKRAAEKLASIHSKLKLMYGSLLEEYPEQLMTVMYLPADAKVLELGGNVGRNSCVIATILNDSKNLVAVESSKESASLLMENRNLNGLQFHVEPSAVSKVPLIQKDWNTIPSDVDLPGYERVNTMTFDELMRKYGIEFDTMVVDCEGALYYMLRDDPGILKNIKLMIVENDYVNIQHFKYVEEQFINYGLQLVYNRAGEGGTCGNNFYQVWKK